MFKKFSRLVVGVLSVVLALSVFVGCSLVDKNSFLNGGLQGDENKYVAGDGDKNNNDELIDVEVESLKNEIFLLNTDKMSAEMQSLDEIYGYNAKIDLFGQKYAQDLKKARLYVQACIYQIEKRIEAINNMSEFFKNIKIEQMSKDDIFQKIEQIESLNEMDRELFAIEMHQLKNAIKNAESAENLLNKILTFVQPYFDTDKMLIASQVGLDCAETALKHLKDIEELKGNVFLNQTQVVKVESQLMLILNRVDEIKQLEQLIYNIEQSITDASFYQIDSSNNSPSLNNFIDAIKQVESIVDRGLSDYQSKVYMQKILNLKSIFSNLEFMTSFVQMGIFQINFMLDNQENFRNEVTEHCMQLDVMDENILKCFSTVCIDFKTLIEICVPEVVLWKNLIV